MGRIRTPLGQSDPISSANLTWGETETTGIATFRGYAG